ncbi:hypothetical protein CVS40_11659 [Lucilia cuprina]|nr:hypothetical protein CVS40_11659 [Lucilia cuprina]
MDKYLKAVRKNRHRFRTCSRLYMYINHSKLSPVTKLYHLRNKTRGEADDIVTWSQFLHKNFKNCFTLTNAPETKIQTYTSQENLYKPECKLCNEIHSLKTCPKFRNFTVQQRMDYVFKNKICNNCLSSSHFKINAKVKELVSI